MPERFSAACPVLNQLLLCICSSTWHDISPRWTGRGKPSAAHGIPCNLLLSICTALQTASILPCSPAPPWGDHPFHQGTGWPNNMQGEATKPIFLSDQSLPPGSKSYALLWFSSQNPFEKSLDEFQLGCLSQSHLVPFPPALPQHCSKS